MRLLPELVLVCASISLACSKDVTFNEAQGGAPSEPSSGGRRSNGDGGRAETKSGGAPGSGGQESSDGGTRVNGGTSAGGASDQVGGKGTIGSNGSGSAAGGEAGGAGGRSAAGGEAGIGGSSAGGSATACGPTCSTPSLLDDFDDGDVVACPRTGWTSGWWFATDGLGTLSAPSGASNTNLPSELSPPRGSSCGGLHLQGSGFTDWGTNLAITLSNPDDTVPRPVSLAAYTGVSFWIRGSGTLRFMLSTTDTDPPENGGTCSGSCKQYFTQSSSTTIPNTWTQVTVEFASLYSGTVARSLSAADLQKVMFMGFATNATFDVWLDDVSFTE